MALDYSSFVGDNTGFRIARVFVLMQSSEQANYHLITDIIKWGLEFSS
jgi:hypothetical protein